MKLTTYIGMMDKEKMQDGTALTEELTLDTADTYHMTSYIDDDGETALYDAYSIARYIFREAEPYDIRAALNTAYEFDEDGCCYISKGEIIDAMSTVVKNCKDCRIMSKEVGRMCFITEEYIPSVWRTYAAMQIPKEDGGDANESEL